jgi:hypothetical protein
VAEPVPETAPLRGWRYWQTSPRRRLRSVAQRHFEWPPGRAISAVCVGGGHPAPDPTCWCGVSGARDVDALRDHGLCVLPGPLVVGQVDLWGKVLEESYGWRAQFARPATIGLVAETVEDLAVRELLVADLAAYGVPISLVPLDEAVAGTTKTMLEFQVMSHRASRGGLG